MFVRAAHRRRGHARALLRALEDRARSQGYRRVMLETGLAQPEAIALYESEGYQPIDGLRPLQGRAAVPQLRQGPVSRRPARRRHGSQPSCSSTKHQRHASPGSKLRITGCPVSSKCPVACRSGEESQQPTWPQVRHSRRCTQRGAVAQALLAAVRACSAARRRGAVAQVLAELRPVGCGRSARGRPRAALSSSRSSSDSSRSSALSTSRSTSSSARARVAGVQHHLRARPEHLQPQPPVGLARRLAACCRGRAAPTPRRPRERSALLAAGRSPLGSSPVGAQLLEPVQPGPRRVGQQRRPPAARPRPGPGRAGRSRRTSQGSVVPWSSSVPPRR